MLAVPALDAVYISLTNDCMCFANAADTFTVNMDKAVIFDPQTENQIEG